MTPPTSPPSTSTMLSTTSCRRDKTLATGLVNSGSFATPACLAATILLNWAVQHSIYVVCVRRRSVVDCVHCMPARSMRCQFLSLHVTFRRGTCAGRAAAAAAGEAAREAGAGGARGGQGFSGHAAAPAHRLPGTHRARVHGAPRPVRFRPNFIFISLRKATAKAHTLCVTAPAAGQR